MSILETRQFSAPPRQIPSRWVPRAATLIFPLTYTVPTVLVCIGAWGFAAANTPAMNLVTVAITIGALLLLVGVAVAAWQLWQLVGVVATPEAVFATAALLHSRRLVRALQFMLLPLLGLLPLSYVIAEVDDAPGVVVVGLLPLLYTLALLSLARVFNSVLQHGLALQEEVELTI